MFFVKHTIVSGAGFFGAVFGYVSAETETWTIAAALAGMFVCAWTADMLTRSLEVNEDE